MTPQKKRQVSFSGIEVEIEGGVLQSCEAELQCSECGAVACGDGYLLKDRDVDVDDEEGEGGEEGQKK